MPKTSQGQWETLDHTVHNLFNYLPKPAFSEWKTSTSQNDGFLILDKDHLDSTGSLACPPVRQVLNGN